VLCREIQFCLSRCIKQGGFYHEHEKEKPMIKVMHFLQDLKRSGGSYQTVEKQLHRIDDIEKKIIFKDRTTIQFDDIISIEHEGF